MSITISKLNFDAGTPIGIQGLTDIEGAVAASIGDTKVSIDETGAFEFALSAIEVAGSYSVAISILDKDSKTIGNEDITLVITEVPEIVVDPVNLGPVVPTDHPAKAPITDAQALIDSQSTGLTYISKLDGLGIPTDTDHIKAYPGSVTGFMPLTGEAHAGSSAHEFKIMPDEALAKNPSAGFTGGRGTGNPDNFGKFPYRALMHDTRGEFFSKEGDFDANTVTPYPLGRTADILENSNYPVGFTAKDAKGYSTTTTRGGVNASPFPTGGITF